MHFFIDISLIFFYSSSPSTEAIPLPPPVSPQLCDPQPSPDIMNDFLSEEDTDNESIPTQAQPLSQYSDEIKNEFEHDDSDEERDDWSAFKSVSLSSSSASKPTIDRKTTSSSSSMIDTKKRKRIVISDTSDDDNDELIVTPAPKKRSSSPPQLSRSLTLSSTFYSPVPFRSPSPPTLNIRRVKKMIVTTEFAEDGSVLSENTKKTYYN